MIILAAAYERKCCTRNNGAFINILYELWNLAALSSLDIRLDTDIILLECLMNNPKCSLVAFYKIFNYIHEF